VNDTISTQGAALDKILQSAKPLPESPKVAVSSALDSLKTELPGGSEETLGKAIDKEATRYSAALDSKSPLEINQTIRELDQRISDYSAPENQLEGPASAKDAALVTIRRTLRDSLNSAYPETKPINKQLGDAIEVRSVLRSKLGQVANDPTAATQQYQSELAKGQDQLSRDIANENLQQRYNEIKERNAGRRKVALGVVGGAGALEVGKQVLKNLVP
jgi:hypothetical protein